MQMFSIELYHEIHRGFEMFNMYGSIKKYSFFFHTIIVNINKTLPKSL